MKLFSFFKVGLIASVLIFISFLLIMNDADTHRLSKKISRYNEVADSLHTVVQLLGTNVRHKDSLLLIYLSSLDRTLEELNKESMKNHKAIAHNFNRQDSVRNAYCIQMKQLQQTPDDCIPE